MFDYFCCVVFLSGFAIDMHRGRYGWAAFALVIFAVYAANVAENALAREPKEEVK